MDFTRILELDLHDNNSIFLWGLRKSGKSTYLKKRYPNSIYYDFLKNEVRRQYTNKPELLREEILALEAKALKEPIIIDEVQKVPQILDEIHWLIENTSASFILCGSSARKLKRGAANLLGGRAWTYTMHPLVSKEIPDFDLLRALNCGLLPSHYLSKNPQKALKSYVGEYLYEEIQAEGLVRNLPNFSRFLEVFAYSNTELTNYSNIARDCGVNANTVKDYYQILIDTLVGYYIHPYSKSESRDTLRSTPKFYLADIGLAAYLSQKTIKSIKGSDAGKAFENFILMELVAYRDLHDKNFVINFWRNKNKLEVDFIINRGAIAIEVKIAEMVNKADLKGLLEFKSRHPTARAIVVSQDQRKRKLILQNGIEVEVIPWQEFLEALWQDEIIGDSFSA